MLDPAQLRGVFVALLAESNGLEIRLANCASPPHSAARRKPGLHAHEIEAYAMIEPRLNLRTHIATGDGPWDLALIALQATFKY